MIRCPAISRLERLCATWLFASDNLPSIESAAVSPILQKSPREYSWLLPTASYAATGIRELTSAMERSSLRASHPETTLLMFDSAGLYCRMPITVADRDVDGIVAELVPGPNLEGTIKMDGAGHFAKPPTLQLIGNFSTNPIDAKEDGTFGWTNLAPTQYAIVYRPPEDGYVKSVQFNRQAVNIMRIDLTSGTGGTVDIVVAPNAASLSVSVEGGKAAQIALWNDSAFHTSDIEAGETANFQHLGPGEYRILAWQKVESEFVNIPEFRARFDPQKITLAEGSHENIEVKLIPKSASEAEIAKLQ
jgi:hypothetical protein